MAMAAMRRENPDALLTGLAARLAIRRDKHSGPTSGLAPGFVQANLAILPQALAQGFLQLQCSNLPITLFSGDLIELLQMCCAIHLHLLKAKTLAFQALSVLMCCVTGSLSALLLQMHLPLSFLYPFTHRGKLPGDL